MSLPTVTLTGNLTADPNLRFTPAGKPVVNFRVAASDRRKNQTTGEWEDGDACFLDVVAWNNAEAIADALHKGTTVMLTGTLVQRSYETKEGEKRTTNELKADQVAVVIRQRNTAPAIQAEDPWATTGEAPF